MGKLLSPTSISDKKDAGILIPVIHYPAFEEQEMYPKIIDG